MLEDKLEPPWYKQFWPWFIIALPGMAVLGGIITLVISLTHSHSLVVSEYYKEGLAINESLQQERMARQMQIHAEIVFSPSMKQVTARLSSRLPELLPSIVNLYFIHPTSDKKDFVLPLQRRENKGEYRQSLAEMQEGFWKLQLSPLYLDQGNQKTRLWKLSARIDLKTQKAISLGYSSD